MDNTTACTNITLIQAHLVSRILELKWILIDELMILANCMHLTVCAGFGGYFELHPMVVTLLKVSHPYKYTQGGRLRTPCVTCGGMRYATPLITLAPSVVIGSSWERERAIKGEGERSTELEMKDGWVIDAECCRDNFHGLVFVPGEVRW